MKTMKKLLALLLALGLVFALTACGNGDSESSQTPSEDVTESQEPAASDEGGATGDYGESPTVEEGKLIMSTNAAFPPYEMTSDGEGYNGTGFEGIDVEVLDLRTLVPLDWDAIVKSVSKTHNVIIVSEEVKRGSYAGELSAQIAEELFDELDAPVERVCGLNICSPFSPVLEDKNFPHPEDIVRAVKRVLNK